MMEAGAVRSLTDLVPRLRRVESMQAVLAALANGKSGTIDGAWGSSCALAAAALADECPGTLLILLPRISDLDDFTADLASLLGHSPTIFPAWESLPKEHVVSDEVFGARLRVLQQLESISPPKVVLAAIAALVQPVPGRAEREASTRKLSVGDEIEVDELLRWLVDRGFERTPAIERPGEFSVHGGIIDIFTPDVVDPIRLELFGDEIESIRLFDVETQRKTEDRQTVSLVAISPVESTELPASETANRSEQEKVSSQTKNPLTPAPHRQKRGRGDTQRTGTKGDSSVGLSQSFTDSLPPGSWVVYTEPRELAEEGRHYLQRLSDPRGLFSVEAVFAHCGRFPSATLSVLAESSFEASSHLQVESIERFTGPKTEVLLELASFVGREETVLIACHNEGERQRLEEMLQESAPEFAPRVNLCVGTVTRGYRLVAEKLVVLSDNELFNRVEVHRTARRRKRTDGRAIDSFLDLNTGDLVVHLSHGIGRYLGMELLDREGGKEEHLTIEFRDGVKIYVPVTLIHLVQKYVGASKASPRLSKVGGTLWARHKNSVANAVSDMAADMIRMQAARASQPGLQCPPDTKWQKEFEASFPYVETDDQLRAIEDSKHDLELTRPMDRLICGDVGFGKTEVAMRAAFKVVDAGRQVAVLVPTTVLAEQHFRSFGSRMAEFPIAIDVVSRFKTRREQSEVLDRLAAGGIDIIIGTHRLVQQDVHFRNLGLVIIDEEQRFGVDAKEMLKRLRLEVDILTLSATPIPRTLHMSLLGVRDISNLTTPPQDRMAIETRICRWDGELIRSAVVRELNRGGQVYFVHNRVYDIHMVAERLQSIIPEARIVIGHGQMSPDELESAMLKFVTHQADILLATTIIESGLDIPNANTMFIDQAEIYGLADLHQLRGRVGRHKHRAYCYLLVSEDKPLTGIAARRLKAIEEFSELGAGFKISMRDLEIRGAGNILGTEQSGHISVVGYELYCQLLENAVRHLKQMPERENPHVNIELPVPAFLPSSYIPPGRPKIDVYRKLSSLATLQELEEATAELRDRFGPLPDEAVQFLKLKELELLAYQWRIAGIRLEEGRFAVFTYMDAKLIRQLAAKVGSDLRIVDKENAYLLLPKRDMKGPPLVEHLRGALW